MQKCSFFNSVNGDRKYNALDFTAYFADFFTNGIFNNSLKVKASSGMNVIIESGKAFVEGYKFQNLDNLSKTINISDNIQSRIDNVVIRLDIPNRNIDIQIIQGDYATTPVAPPLTRNNEIYDLRIAKINVPAGTTEITQDLIEDCRFSSDCGNVIQAVQCLDTTDIFEQYDTAFNNWFNQVKEELSNTPIGNLEQQILDLTSEIESIRTKTDKLSVTENDELSITASKVLINDKEAVVTDIEESEE